MQHMINRYLHLIIQINAAYDKSLFTLLIIQINAAYDYTLNYSN